MGDRSELRDTFRSYHSTIPSSGEERESMDSIPEEGSLPPPEPEPEQVAETAVLQPEPEQVAETAVLQPEPETAVLQPGQEQAAELQPRNRTRMRARGRTRAASKTPQQRRKSKKLSAYAEQGASPAEKALIETAVLQPEPEQVAETATNVKGAATRKKSKQKKKKFACEGKLNEPSCVFKSRDYDEVVEHEKNCPFAQAVKEREVKEEK